MAAVILLALAMLTAGAVELAELTSEKSSMQDVADEAALNGAAQMDLSLSDGVLDRTSEVARTALAKLGRRADFQVQTTYVNKGTAIQVAVHAHRMSFFANLLPPGGFDIDVHSIATSEGRVPLCVLAHGSDDGKTIELKSTSQISAPGCFIQSNQNITVDNTARLVGFEVRAVSGAKGPISPTPKTDAAPIPDPFTSLDLARKSCPLIRLPEVYTNIISTIPAGLHCGKVTVLGFAEVTLAPGDHYFADDLIVQDTSKLVGRDVVLGFAPQAKFEFKNQSTVSLDGRKSGPLAGFVIYSTRDNTHDFTIDSDHVNTLLGTIYIPSAQLRVSGNKKVADASATFLFPETLSWADGM